MAVEYAPSYIDALFARKDVSGLHTVVSVRARTHSLPEECVIFLRILEWLGPDRAGSWQHYQTMTDAQYSETCRLLCKFGMTDVLEVFRAGREEADGPARVDDWLYAHGGEVQRQLLRILESVAEVLKRNA